MIGDQQRSPEWFAARVGKVTASRFDDVVATKRDGSSTSERERYMFELCIEIMTGIPSEHYVSYDMKWGTQWEDEARMNFEAKTGTLVTTCGFIDHPRMPRCGASPDGLIDDDGSLEIKCPRSANHLRTIVNGMDEKHKAQVQGQLWVTDRKYAMFVSFDPRLPKSHWLYIERIERDDAYIAKLRKAVETFQAELSIFMQDLVAKAA